MSEVIDLISGGSRTVTYVWLIPDGSDDLEGKEEGGIRGKRRGGSRGRK